ncbi:MAG: dethiobiotin synthase [Parashewanella sp.]
MLYFVTGTDTDCGKTFVASAILEAVNQWAANTNTSISTLGFKPIASGCDETDHGLRNSDALALMKASSIKLEYDQINPITFKPAIAPHIAAEQLGVDLSFDTALACLKAMTKPHADFSLIEGAGGWHLPLNHQQFLSDVVAELQLPVILVVGMKLGCLNHALLTERAIKQSGLSIAGWVANGVDVDMQMQAENLESLKHMLDAPCLGLIPHLKSATATHAAAHLNISSLL